MRHRSIFVSFAIAASASIGAATVASVPVSAAGVAAGFADSLIADVSSPTAVEWLPNDRIAVLEKSGRLKIGAPGAPLTTALTLGNVCTDSERGLLGLAPSPSFLGDGLIYLYYTHDSGGTCMNRVSRFRMADDVVDPASELVLLDGISSNAGNHNGGDLDIGSDGLLYVSVGDAGRDPRGDSGSAGGNDAAQDLSLLNGKILRVDLTGAPAPGNPFGGPGTAPCAFRGNTAATPATICQEIFAWGLRNPYRIAFDRNDGSDRFFINDVGQGTLEEVDEGGVARNYGWPIREGSCPQGQTPPCPGPSTGITDPITSYGRGLGTFITAGAFVPNGLWPAAYDGSYLFADGGSGDIWIRGADGSLDFSAPFATGAPGITDMTFGFDPSGRMTLYYVQVGGELRAIAPTGPLRTTTTSGLRTIPVRPFRAYDTDDAIGVAKGAAFNGTTRRVDLDPPGSYEAALVNITSAATTGPGFLRAWGTQAARPNTSSVNADQPFSFVANAAIVPLDADGAFMLESTTTGRIIVDVMGWLDDTGGSSTDGRFVAQDPARLIDTRITAGTKLESGSTNQWTRTNDQITVGYDGQLGLSANGQVGAVVLSIGAIAGTGFGGFVGAFPGGSTYSNTSNVNVVNGEVRANTVVVPTDATGTVALKTLDIADVVVDVLGYITSSAAPASTTGLYTSVDPFRIVDTRLGQGFGRMQPLQPAGIAVAGAGSASAVVQNITATGTSGPGWVAAHPTPTAPIISNVNFTAPSQTRAALAFTRLSGGNERFTALVGTDLVVDVVGFFSG